MSDAALPFRPRALGTADRALDQIDAQTRSVRIRSNRHMLAGAFFIAAGTALVCCALLILLALRLSPGEFKVVTWMILAGVALAFWRKGWQTRRAWVPAAKAAAVIDERARLEDRLATLAASTEASRRSRLWSFLLHENLRLAPIWEAKRFVPRAVPTSSRFFVIALLVFLFALWRMPHPRHAGPQAPPDVAASEPPAPDPSGEEEQGEQGPEESQQGLPRWADLPETIRQAILGSQSSQSFAGKIPGKTAPVMEDKGGPAIVGQRMANNGGPVRSMPAGPNAPKPGERGPGANAAPAPNPKSAAGGEAHEPPPLARGDAPKMLPPAESGKPQGPTSKGKGKSAEGGSGGGGAGTGGDADGLYGDPQAPGKYSGSFRLDLDATQSEQASHEGEPGGPDVRPDGRLAPDQRLDDAIRRAQVPVEYEKIVQRIFNRSGDEDAKP